MLSIKLPRSGSCQS